MRDAKLQRAFFRAVALFLCARLAVLEFGGVGPMIGECDAYAEAALIIREARRT
jgi:hypothetical protein